MRIGQSKTKHVHLKRSNEEDPVTVRRTERGYYFRISPKRDAHDYRSGPFQTEHQAWSAAQQFIRSNWRPIE